MKLLLFFFIALTARAQLMGVIDIHAHSAPDSVGRSIDAVDLAKLAKTNGMRGLVLKNHYESTAALATIVRKVVPGIEVFGGIDLNLSVGGLNPAAIERMVLMQGHWGRMIWMPTFDAENQVKFSKENRPWVSVMKDGQLLPAAKQVIALAAKHNLTLQTGHSNPAEGLAILREAKAQGVRHLIVTHAMVAPVQMSIPQMQQAAQLGAYIEFVYNAAAGKTKQLEMSDYVKAIRAVGPAHCILSSDLGQEGNPLHPEGLKDFFAQLARLGLPQSDIRMMSVTNPAVALGLN